MKNKFSNQEIEFLNNFSDIRQLASFAEGEAQKSAAISELFNKVVKVANENPKLASAIAGGLGGSVLGAGSAVLIGNKKKKLRNALLGALIGGGLGAGAGYAGSKFLDYKAQNAVDQVKAAIKDRDIDSVKSAAKILRKERNAEFLKNAKGLIEKDFLTSGNNSLSEMQSKHQISQILEGNESGGIIGGSYTHNSTKDPRWHKWDSKTRDLLKTEKLDPAQKDNIIESAIASRDGRAFFNGINPNTGKPYTPQELSIAEKQLLGETFLDDRVNTGLNSRYKEVYDFVKTEKQSGGKQSPGFIDRISSMLGLSPGRLPIEGDIDAIKKTIDSGNLGSLPPEFRDPEIIKYIINRS